MTDTSDDGPIRLTRRLAPWFEAAFRTRGMHERFLWEISFGVVPDQQGRPVPQVTFFASLPAATLGNTHMSLRQFIPIGVTEAIVDELVGAVIEELLANRSAELAQLNGLKKMMPSIRSTDVPGS